MQDSLMGQATLWGVAIQDPLMGQATVELTDWTGHTVQLTDGTSGMHTYHSV